MERHSSAVHRQTFAPLVEVVMPAQAFSAYWPHCDYIAAYLARTIGHNRTDSTLYSSLFSSAVNELLEIAHRHRHGAGKVTCKVSRRGDVDRIELSIPSGERERQALLRAIEQISEPGSEARYLKALADSTDDSPAIGLLELVHEYDAAISANADEEGKTTLVVDLRLERSEPA